MARYDIIHDRIAKGRGKAAQRVGQPFLVQRLDFDGFKIMDPPIFCLLRRMSGGPHIEQRFFASQVFELVCDVRRLKIGDVLTEAQQFKHAQPFFETTVLDEYVPESQVGTVTQAWKPSYLVVQARPVHKFIGVRVELLCQVRRGQFPVVDGAGGYQEEGINAESVLVLTPGSGAFHFENVRSITAPLTPSLIPFQMEMGLIRGRTEFDLPMDWFIGKWHFVCPGSWLGLSLRENDTIIHPDGTRFRIHQVFESHIGPEIIQGLAEKLES